MESSSTIKQAPSLQTLPTSTVWRTTMNLVLTSVGVGVLALPRAISQAGIYPGICLLLLCAILTHYMMTTLASLLFEDNGKRKELTRETYEQVGYAAFGSIGKIFVSVVLYCDLVTVCSLLVILFGSGVYNLVTLFQSVEYAHDNHLTDKIFMVLFAVIMCPLSAIRSLREVSILSAIGILATFLVVIAVIIAAILKIEYDHEHDIPIVENYTPASIVSFFLAIANFLNSYTVGPVVPTLVHSMKRPLKFTIVSILSFSIVTFVFAAIGVSGFVGWGVAIEDYGDLGSAIAHSEGVPKYIAVIVQFGILIIAISHFLVMYAPIGKAIDRQIEKKVLSSVSTGQDNHIHRKLLVYSIICRISVVLVCLLIAVTVPNFGVLVDFLGATFVIFLQIFFPIIFLFKLRYNMQLTSIPKLHLFGYMTCLVIGGLGLIFGVYGSVREF